MTASTAVTPFLFNTSTIRVVTLEGNPWFVAADVCKVLKLTNTTQSLRHLDDGEKGLNRIETLGGVQRLNIISESGLYKLIMRSDKPQAKAFQDWVSKEVLPSIRKTGSFVTGQPSLVENPQMDPLDLMLAQAELLPKLIEQMKEQRRIAAEQAKTIEAQAAELKEGHTP